MDHQDPEYYEQLMRLRQLTELTGALHEAQLYQLKMWNSLLFNSDSTVEVFNEPKNKRIVYKTIGAVDNLSEKATHVSFWTRKILGKDFEIEVKNKGIGKKTYRSIHVLEKGHE